MSRTTMPTLSEFAAQQPNPRAKCPVCRLPETVLQEVRANAGEVPGTVIAAWLEKVHGVTISDTAVRACNKKHRK